MSNWISDTILRVLKELSHFIRERLLDSIGILVKKNPIKNRLVF